jgi:hypothetical protein
MQVYRFSLRSKTSVVVVERKFADDVEALEVARLLAREYDVDVRDEEEVLIGAVACNAC